MTDELEAEESEDGTCACLKHGEGKKRKRNKLESLIDEVDDGLEAFDEKVESLCSQNIFGD